MAEINDLNISDASNTARFPEGQAPSTLNNGARGLEGMLARGFKDAVEPSLNSTGSSNAYIVAANRTLSAYYDGLRVAFHASFANTDAATLNVDSVGAKAIKKNHDVALISGDIEQHQVVEVVYSASDDAWQMVSPAGNATLSSGDIGATVQPYDADTLKADTADVLTAGFSATGHDFGTKTTGTFTPDPDDDNFQYGVNGGAHTLAPPTNNCTLILQYTNNGSAGTITTSGFTLVDGGTLTTTNGDDFLLFITKINGFSHLAVKALQ